MKIKILSIWLLVIVVTFAFVFTPKQGEVSASSLTTQEDEFVYDEEGNKLYLNTMSTETTERTTVTNEAGEEVATVSINIEEDIAYLNGEMLSPEEFNAVKSFASQDSGQTIDLYQPYGVKYNYAGTKNGSIWLAKAGVVGIAAFIAALAPGTSWGAAWNAAAAIAGMSNNAYYKMKIYYGYSSNYVHVKRVITFYKDSARTKVLYGPITAYQKKGNRY